MKRFFVLLVAVATVCKASQSYDEVEEDKPQDKRSVEHAEYAGAYGAPQLLSQHVEIEKHVPVVQYQGFPVAVPHPVPFAVHVPVHVPQPVPVHVPIQVPVYKTVTVPVEKPVPYEVERPYPVEVVKKVPVHIPKPYPVPVPIYKTKHIYREIIYPKRHGW